MNIFNSFLQHRSVTPGNLRSKTPADQATIARPISGEEVQHYPHWSLTLTTDVPNILVYYCT